MFNNLKYKKSLKALAKQARTISRQRKIYNLTTARNVGIVFNVTDSKTFDTVLQFIAKLEKIPLNVDALAYYSEKEIPQIYVLNEKIDVFSKNETNWYYKPQSPVVDSFISKEHDILVDLTREESVPLRWISTLSRAKFKVGVLNYFNNPFDLIISIDEGQSLDYIVEQTYNTLESLNNRFSQEQEK
ncbi:DUF6913 domain-containing protein [Tenuifilum thalassicum]|uniref:Uncharacterized protein n=1 Tax=Tenuifilum thalassicum TaxID=2590900 RepID=A0A7D3XDV5_9BACT|nr:hypothetical protein [Tenuifilum thalassicum]QKG79852.1 hypothetical protein FHG85_06115 [Tenuifilum thalassicum]